MRAISLFRAPLCAGLALALAACAVGPDYRQPPTEAPLVWNAPLPHEGKAGALAEWWQQFDDPMLAKLIAMAEADSPSLTKAWANIEKARANLTTSKAGGLPSLTQGGSATRSKQQMQGGGESIIDSHSQWLDASWEIDLWGKARRNTEAARARVEARVGDWHNAQVSLAAEVASSYVQYRACGLLADAYQHELDSITQTLDATTALVQAGFRARSEGSLAQANFTNTRASLVAQRGQCELLVKSLVNLTGTDETGLRALLAEGGAKLPQPAVLEVRSVPADVLRQRPDLASLERELAAASAGIGVAKADLYPSLSLFGSLTTSASDIASSATTWSFGPSLSLPVFDGGKRHAAVKSAEASYTAALADYRQGVRDVVEDVEQALVNLNSAGHRAEDAEIAAREYRNYFLAIEANWRAGRDDLFTLEEARRNALSAEIQQITLQRDRVTYWVALYKALGGGWQANTPASPPDALADQPKNNTEGAP